MSRRFCKPPSTDCEYGTLPPGTAPPNPAAYGTYARPANSLSPSTAFAIIGMNTCDNMPVSVVGAASGADCPVPCTPRLNSAGHSPFTRSVPDAGAAFASGANKRTTAVALTSDRPTTADLAPGPAV